MPWICPSCSAETELGYNVCAKCQAPRPGSEAGQGDFKLDDGNPILIIADLVSYIAVLVFAELVIPYLMYRFLGVPPVLGALIVFAVFGCVVYCLARRTATADARPNG